MTEIDALARRIDRIEARQAIAELPARYARAVDSRDIEAWLTLFIDDVDCGKRGKGREALRRFIDPNLRTFYRSIHFIGGHVVDFEDADHANGTVYCRAEHEDGDRWIAMAIVYFDRYARRDGTWYFVERREKHWYSANVLDRPAPPFQHWPRWANRLPELPGDFPSWRPFWASSSDAEIGAITAQPVAGPHDALLP